MVSSSLTYSCLFDGRNVRYTPVRTTEINFIFLVCCLEKQILLTRGTNRFAPYGSWSSYPTEELPLENYLYAHWARYTVVRYTYGAIYTLYAIYFASEMHLKSPTQFRNLPLPISNLQLNKKYPPATAGGYLLFNLRYRYSVFTLTESTQAECSDSWVTF